MFDCTGAAIAELSASGQEFAALVAHWRKGQGNTIDIPYADSIRKADRLYREASGPETSRDVPDMRRQYHREPYQAICDSIVSIAIPGVFMDIHSDPTRSFNLMYPTEAGASDSTVLPVSPTKNLRKVTGITPLWALSQSRTVSLRFLDGRKDLSDNMLLRVEVSKRYYSNAQLAWVEVGFCPFVFLLC